jgi:competence protein ComFB
MEFEHNGEIYTFSNAIEDEVLEKVQSAVKNDADMCKCKKCYYDVCAIALNNIGISKYTTSQHGALISKVASAMNMESIGVISVEIIKAINMVKGRPNH